MRTHQGTHLHFGVFRDAARAQRAIQLLMGRGVPADAITVVHPTATGDLVADPEVEEATPTAEAAPAAMLGGSAIGAVLGGGAALAAITLTGGLGAVVIGPLLGAGGAGAVVGGLIGALVSRGVRPDVADLYDQALRRGHVLVAVEGKSESVVADADQVFQEVGIEPVAVR